MQPLALPGRRLSVAEANSLRRAWQLGVQKIKDLLHLRNTFGDQIRIRDEIRFYWGSPEDIAAGKARLFRVTKGHIVNIGLWSMVNWLSGHYIYSNGGNPLPYSLNWAAKSNSYMRVGTGGSVTTGATTTLTAMQNTPADGQSGANSNPGGTYRLSWMATWNAGTLPAITVTEVGLFLYLWNALQVFGFGNYCTSGSYGASQGDRLFSRLSVADGDFDAFAINTAVPLTIEWRLIFEFA